MLNSEKKIALCPTKKKNILTLVWSKKKFSTKKRPIAPLPLQVKWLVPYKQRIDGVMVGMLTSCVVVCDFHLYRGVI
jgi:hypothetical protein